MSSERPIRLATQRLAADLFGGAGDPRLPDVLGWLTGSPRFAAFAEANRTKIRKKIRGARDEEAWRDVRAELVAARLLLVDRRIELTFEPAGSGRGGPDLGVSFRGAPALMLEVTRRRELADEATLGRVVLSKLRQLPAGSGNALLVMIESWAAPSIDVAAAVRALRTRADARDDAFFAYRGVDGAKTFYERFLRLGGVFVRSEPAAGPPGVTFWSNPSARIALPARAAAAILGCLEATA